MNIILSILLFSLILFVIFVATIIILAKRTEAFDLSEESEELIINNKNKKNGSNRNAKSEV